MLPVRVFDLVVETVRTLVAILVVAQLQPADAINVKIEQRQTVSGTGHLSVRVKARLTLEF